MLIHTAQGDVANDATCAHPRQRSLSLVAGAAGATSWERCCLGLPTILLVLADNQRQVAQGLEQSQAARIIEKLQDIGSCLPKLLRHVTEHPAALQLMSQSATRIVDGKGVTTVVHLMESLP